MAPLRYWANPPEATYEVYPDFELRSSRKARTGSKAPQDEEAADYLL